MLIEIVLACLGLALLTVAADHLVIGSSRLATAMRISPVVVGVVVIGLGTSAPEFLVSGIAAASGESTLALGNLIGSNILNLTLILGVAGLISTVGVASTVINREVPLSLAGVLILAFAVWAGLGIVVAVLLALLMLVALFLLVRWARAGYNQAVETEVVAFTDGRSRRLWFDALRAVAGLAGVLGGAQLLVANASKVAAELGVPDLVIGFTLVAVGTSLPELVTTIHAMRRRESELVVGNLFGSNLFNSLLGGSVIGFAGGGVRVDVQMSLLIAMVLTATLAWALLKQGLRLQRVEALVLLGAYGVTVPMLLA